MLKVILRTFMFVFQSLLIISITGCTTIVSEKIPNTNPVAKSTQTIEVPPTEISTALPTEPPTPTTTEKPPASTEWQVSPDGHIVYNEYQLYDGMFTINKEHPEYIEKYWEELVRGLWNLNFVGENTAFLSQFPTDDSLVEHFRNGGEPVSNLLIPSIYPDGNRRFSHDAVLLQTDGPLDLSQIAISIYKPTREEIYKYSPSYSSGTKYISYLEAAGSVWVQEMKFNDHNILSMTFRKDLLMESRWVFPTNRNCDNAEVIYIPSFEGNEPSDHNLLAATELLHSWTLIMQISDTCNGPAIQKNFDPAVLNIGIYSPLYQDMKEAISVDKTPLALR